MGGKNSFEWIGATSALVVIAASAISAVPLVYLHGLLKEPSSLAPILWTLGAVAVGAILNVIGQSMACFGLVVPGRCRWWSAFTILAGMTSLVAATVVTVAIFWEGGFFSPE